MDTPDSKQEKEAAGVSEKSYGAGKLGIAAVLSLLFGVLFFAGFFTSFPDMPWLKAFDFQALSGTFGTMKNPDKATFLGTGGFGARYGFMFAISLVPSVMFALGCMEILSHYGALRAAQKLMTPLLKPLLGIPGLAALTLITDLQSTDAGAAMTKELYDKKLITKKEQIIISSWQYSGAGMISNFFASGPAVFSWLLVPIALPLGVIFVFKFIGAIFVRLVLNTVYRKDFENGK